jgi:hypothetical protein
VLAASSKGLLAVAEADKLHVLDAAPALAAGDAAKAGGAAPSSAALTNPASVPSGIGGPGAVLGGPGSALSAAERAAAAAAAVAAGGSNPSERAGLRSACKASLGFEIVMVSFNAANEQQLLVSGLKDTVALTLGSRGEVVSRVVVELTLVALGTASTHICPRHAHHEPAGCHTRPRHAHHAVPQGVRPRPRQDFARARFPRAR